MIKWLLGLILLPSILLTGCGDKGVVANKAATKVKVIQVGQGDSLNSGQLYFPAIASAANRSHLSFRVAGKVNKLYISDGSRVKKGQLIAEIDPTDYKLAVDNLQASFNVADSRYKRSAELVKKGLLAQSQFDELAAQRMIEKAGLDLAKLRLSFTQLKAPKDGIISRVTVDQFENIQVGQQIANIHDVNYVDVVIQAPDQLFANSQGSAEFNTIVGSVRVNSGQEYPATLKELTTEQDPNTATYTVTLTMPMPEEQLILDGMAVEVTPNIDDFEVSKVVQVNVPIEAIFNADGDEIGRQNKFIWLLNEDNTVHKQLVKTSRVNNGLIKIDQGVDAGQRIVVAGIARLRDGMTVTPMTQEIAK
jgi:RND family efflux transporter MFP subunit